jgi:hypothetical protein
MVTRFRDLVTEMVVCLDGNKQKDGAKQKREPEMERKMC